MRRLLLVGGIVVLVGVVAVIAYVLALRDTATPVDPTDLTATTSAAETAIYVYDTTGYEAVDALSGARHEYPAQTYLTITEGPCGPIARWDALEERWVEWEHCGPHRAITATHGYHEWFGVPDLEDEVCPEPMPLIPNGTVVVACVTGDTTETYTITLIGREPIAIGGSDVSADHVRIDSVLSGGSTGSSQVDLWVLADSVIVVKTVVERHTTTPSRVGDVHYDELYTLVLASLEPTE